MLIPSSHVCLPFPFVLSSCRTQLEHYVSIRAPVGPLLFSFPVLPLYCPHMLTRWFLSLYDFCVILMSEFLGMDGQYNSTLDLHVWHLSGRKCCFPNMSTPLRDCKHRPLWLVRSRWDACMFFRSSAVNAKTVYNSWSPHSVYSI